MDETLGDFDEEIEREKTFAEERANGNDDGILSDVDEFEEYNESQDEPTIAGRSSGTSTTEEADSGAQSSTAASGEAGAQGGRQGEQREGDNPEPDADQEEVSDRPDIEDLRKNDDIVARQLRESAEAEKDPELKKRYWEDYYKYKGVSDN